MIPFSGNVIGGNCRHDNALGAGLYLSAAGVDDATKIRYRNGRPLAGHVLCSGVDWNPGSVFLHDACVAIVASPTTEITHTLPAAYHNATCWAQVRTHSNGVENETLFRPQRITLDVSGDGSNTIDGSALVTATEKRDGGGLRVRFIYFAADTGLTPATFTLSRTAGPTTPDDVTATYLAGTLEYTIDVAGLQDAGAYTFALKASNGATEKTLETINFTADAAGPGVVQNLTAEVC